MKRKLKIWLSALVVCLCMLPIAITNAEEATGRMQTIEIHNVDKNTQSGISGSTFALYRKDSLQPIDQKTTDFTGRLAFDVDEAGSYLIKQTKIKGNRLRNTQVLTFEVENTANEATRTFKFENSTATAMVQVLAKDTGLPVAGMSVTARDTNHYTGLNYESSAVTVTDRNGYATFTGIWPGSYEIKASGTDSQNSYAAREEVYKFVVPKESDTLTNLYEHQFSVSKNFIQFLVQNTAGMKDESVQSVEASLIPVNGTNADKITSYSNQEGIVTFENLKEQAYKLEVKRAALDDSRTQQTLREIYTIQNGDARTGGVVRVLTQDAYDQKVLQETTRSLSVSSVDEKGAKIGATNRYSLYKFEDRQALVAKATATNGVALFEHVPFGKYVVVQDDAPKGTIKDAQDNVVEIVEGDVGEIFRATSVFRKTRVQIQVQNLVKDATGEDTYKPKNARYELIHKTDSEKVETLDEGFVRSGFAIFEDLSAGVYEFKITASDSSHVDASNSITFTIPEKSDKPFKYLNKLYLSPSHFSVETRDVEGTFIKDAKYTVLKDGVEIEGVVSQDASVSTLQYLAPGFYQLKQISVPEQFQLREDMITIEITKSRGVVTVVNKLAAPIIDIKPDPETTTEKPDTKTDIDETTDKVEPSKPSTDLAKETLVDNGIVMDNTDVDVTKVDIDDKTLPQTGVPQTILILGGAAICAGVLLVLIHMRKNKRS